MGRDAILDKLQPSLRDSRGRSHAAYKAQILVESSIARLKLMP
jgi:hypothetical protein